MLVLARKEGEAVRIGADTWVYIVSSGGHNVRLGFKAPSDVEILRKELIDASTVRDTREVRTLLPNDDGSE